MPYLIAFVILLPISVAILIASMIITSSLIGGIDFGPVHMVIIKAIPLLFTVGLISLIPFGGLLALVVWAAGFMILYGLSFTEARVLIVVNWILNLIARLVVFSIVMVAS